MQNLDLNLLTFPFWWYTQGWRLLWQWNKKYMSMGLHQTGLFMFTRHMKEPLYGDYTRTGVILSFFLRVVLLGFKLFWLAMRAVWLAFVDIFYLVILPLALAMIIFQLTTTR